MLDREQIVHWNENRGTHTLWPEGDPTAPLSVRHLGLPTCCICGAVDGAMDDESCAGRLSRLQAAEAIRAAYRGAPDDDT